ncbi:MAG: 3-phenylpropionate/cinnamic acid dioxygenase subunit beta [Chloroflexi bacterium]|nr:3-phenylpropionate/cinnamic acid dioxygenase subunit beta [Chloroflexota bacterium]MCH8987421.1 3-phenylpropionate/cinnamic acid dioxygenase subunit beta [Chloroflexota bacterium]
MRDETIREVEQFLYREARMLDNRQFHEWLELLTDDVRYWMPIRSNRYPVNSKAISILDGSRYEDAEVSSEGDLAFMDEDKDSLTRRIDRLDTGMAWAEDPPSRTRHIITNIEVEAGDSEGELRVYSNFFMYRTRAETEQDFYIGSREDVLRRVGGQLRVASRKIVLDQTVLLAKNLSNFF